jgi:hypothetical protein
MSEIRWFFEKSEAPPAIVLPRNPILCMQRGNVRGIIGLPLPTDLVWYRGGLQPVLHAESDQLPHGVKAPAYCKEALEDSELLLEYAAEIGIEVDADTRSAVLNARALSRWLDGRRSRKAASGAHVPRKPR